MLYFKKAKIFMNLRPVLYCISKLKKKMTKTTTIIIMIIKTVSEFGFHI